MSEPSLKLSYIAAQYRVRVEFNRASTLASPLPPVDIQARAEARLQTEVQKGALAFYKTYYERFVEVWQKLANTDVPDDTVMAVTLATGAPKVEGLELTAANDSEHLAKLTITASKDYMANCRFELFKLTVIKRLEDLGIQTKVDPAHLQAVHLRAQAGRKILEEPLFPLTPHTLAPKAQESFKIVLQNHTKDLTLVVYDVKDIVDEQAISVVLKAVGRGVQLMRERYGLNYEIQKEEVTRKLRSANRGPERMGVDLPLVLLAALAQGPATKSSKAVRGDDLVALNLSPDKMQASIGRIDPNLYEEPDKRDAAAWREYFLARGIKFGLQDEQLAEFCERLKHKKAVDGLVIAEGRRPAMGASPAFVPVFQESPSDDIDIRRSRLFVRKGQLVAEIRLEIPAVIGKTVTGEDVRPEQPELPLVTPGEGIEVRNETQFFATVDGVPEISDQSVSLKQMLIVNSAVNLTTGNIKFDGPVEINGDIESGVTVEVDGDLLVHGMIEGGRIRVAGSLVVDGGIVTGRDGTIRTKGDVTAEFFDNTTIVAGGNVIAKKSITNSDIAAGGDITVESGDGMILSGKLSAWRFIRAANVGRSTGATTVIQLGVRVREVAAVALREKRLEHLQERLKEDKAAMRHFATQKANPQVRKNPMSNKDEAKTRLARLEALVKKAEVHLAHMKSNMSIAEQTALLVENVLARNCHVEACGHKVAIKEDMKGVAVLKDGRRSPMLISIEEAEATLKGENVKAS